MASPPPVSFTFAEGRWFDLWMLVHLLSGVAGGFSNVFWELPVPILYALGLFLLILWEVGEHIGRIRESWPNRVVDVAVGMAGVALAERLAGVMLPSHETVAFVASTGLALVGLGFGVWAYRRRTTASRASAS